MPFHVAAFCSSVDAAAAFTALAPRTDQRLQVTANRLRVPVLNNVVAIAGGADAVVAPRIRLFSPSIEELARYELAEINTNNAAAAVYGSPARIVDLRRSPLPLTVDEDLQVELYNNPAVAQLQFAHVWLADGPITPVDNVRETTVRATAAITAVANEWTVGALTLDDDLPAGEYAVIGLRVQSATIQLGRLNFVGSDALWRPGVPGSVLVSDLSPAMFRHGGMGVFGTFRTTSLPQLEILCNAADTAQVVYLDLVRVS